MLSDCVQTFFEKYLPGIKGVSAQTIKAYRDTFTLFLPFAAQYHSIKIKYLEIDHLTVELILDFLDHLQIKRGNAVATRNHRLAAIKSMARMVRFMYPDKMQLAEKILAIPKKRSSRPLIGFLYPDEVLKVYQAVDLTKAYGIRDYSLLHFLYDSGARASEVATLTLEYFDPCHQTMAILGKGNRYRQVKLWPKTSQLIETYIAQYREKPNPLYWQRLFITQRGDGFTRHGIYKLCKKYLRLTLDPKRLNAIHPAHSFRHACAVRMVSNGDPVTDIKNRLGHENIQSTMTYLQLDIMQKRSIQEKFVEYSRSLLCEDPKLNALIGWENKQEILKWLDSL